MPKPNNPLDNPDTEVVVLLHGLLATSSYWNRVAKRLHKTDHRVVAIDLLGFGTAKHAPAINYSYDEHIAHIHQQLQAQNISTPFVLAGHSMGALLAARYSLEHAADVKNLLLFNPPLYKNSQQAHATLRNTNRAYRFLLDSNYRNAVWSIIKYMPTRLIGDHSAAARDLSIHNVIETAEFIEDLRKVKTKTVLVVGKNDRPIYQENLRSISVPDNVKVAVADVSHHSPILKPDLVARFLLS